MLCLSEFSPAQQLVSFQSDGNRFASFDPATDVNSAAKTINLADHNFVDGDAVTYQVAFGESNITGLSAAGLEINGQFHTFSTVDDIDPDSRRNNAF